MQLSNETLSSIATVMFSSATGALGYFLREYRLRAKPFIAITEVEGGIRDGSALIEIPDDLIKESSYLYYLTGSSLTKSVSVKELSKTLRDIQRIIVDAPAYIKAIDEFLVNSSEGGNRNTAIQVLAQLIEEPIWDSWMCTMLCTTPIQIPKLEASQIDQEEAVEVLDASGMREGCLVFKFPGKTVSLGGDLNNNILLKRQCEKFAFLIKYLNFEKIGPVLIEFQSYTKNALTFCNARRSLLDEMLDNHSRWAISIYMANLGTSPFLVSTHGTMQIRTQEGARYKIPCNLLVYQKDEDGDKSKYMADTPVVINAGSCCNFEFVTAKAQYEIPNGKIIREIFSKGDADCKAMFVIEKAGWFRQKTISTSWGKFVED